MHRLPTPVSPPKGSCWARWCPGRGGQRPAQHPNSAAHQGVSYHHWENDSGRGGLEKPEQGQAEQLDDGEKVHAAQGHVAEVDQVGLVLGGHQEQPHTVRELQREGGRGVTPAQPQLSPTCLLRPGPAGWGFPISALQPFALCADPQLMSGPVSLSVRPGVLVPLSPQARQTSRKDSSWSLSSI